jgi:hypothetical protein
MKLFPITMLAGLLTMVAGCGTPQSPRPEPLDVHVAPEVDVAAADGPTELPPCPAETALLLEAAVTVERGTFPAATLQLRLVARPAAPCRRQVGPATVTLSCAGCEKSFSTQLWPGSYQNALGPGDVASPDDPVLFAPPDVFRLESAPELPTQATIGWESEDAPGSWSAVVPVSLMVENASSPIESTGGVSPFERPQAQGPSTGLAFELGAASAGLGLMGPMLRVSAVVTNGSDRTIQVDRVQFHALVPEFEMRGVDNSTARPMTAWVSGMFFCVRDLPLPLSFPDHTRLAPGQKAWGWLCWTAAAGPASPRWDRTPPTATVTYGDPAEFSAEVSTSPAFMGVFLPP